jgi:hypothetical protein
VIEDLLYVSMILRPALRLLTRPFPLADFAARFLAAVVLPPLLFLAIFVTSRSCVGVKRESLVSMLSAYATTGTLWQLMDEKSIWINDTANLEMRRFQESRRA